MLQVNNRDARVCCRRLALRGRVVAPVNKVQLPRLCPWRLGDLHGTTQQTWFSLIISNKSKGSEVCFSPSQQGTAATPQSWHLGELQGATRKEGEVANADV